MNSDKKIGFIGLGNLGSKLINNLIKGGYHLHIYDINKNNADEPLSKGAYWSKDIRSLLENCSVLITCLPSPNAIKEVIEGEKGVLEFISSNHLWIETSTTDSQEMNRLAKIIKTKGSDVCEATFTGGIHRAISGNISILAGGNRRSFERALPLLKEMAYRILFVSENYGDASLLKIVTNYLASANLVTLGEALIVCAKSGLDLKTCYEGIKISSGNSFVHETESQVMLSRSFNVNFSMDLVCKDVGLFEDLAKKLNIPNQISPLLVKIFNEGKNTYGGNAWSTSIVRLLEEETKTYLQADGFPKELIDTEKPKKGIEIKI